VVQLAIAGDVGDDDHDHEGLAMADMNEVFSRTYAEARDRFRLAATGLTLQSHRCPENGLFDEALSMDVARLGAPDAQAVLLVSSGCHGVEGYCGSGAQIDLLRDADFRARATRAGVAIVMIHALNPWGFSHGRRVTQEGVDLNRNFVDFAHPLPHNGGYDELAKALVPDQWPPDPALDTKIAAYGQAHGDLAWKQAVTSGQYQHPEGLYYGGTAPTWSHRTLRLVLWQHASRAQRVGWIDLHTGLGPSGRGEAIWAGRDDDAGIQRAKGWWGANVTFLDDGSASAPPLFGPMWHTAYEECPQSQFTGIALEFGTVPHEQTLRALRADHWAAAHPKDVTPPQREAIRTALREAFFADTPEWKTAVLAQAREAATRAVEGLGAQGGEGKAARVGSYWG
jgi:hypothetical protein